MVRTKFIHYFGWLTTVYIFQRRQNICHLLLNSLNRLFLSSANDNRCIHATLDFVLLEPVWGKLLLSMESSFFYLKTKTQKPQVPALQRFLQSRQSHLHQHPDFHITSSTILASTLHITRLNRTTTRNRAPSGPNNTTPNQNTETRSPAAAAAAADAGVENPMQHQQQEVNTANANIPVEPNPHAGAMSSFSSMLLRILGGASSEGFNSFLSRFRDTRDEDEAQAFADTSLPNAHHDNLVVD